MFIPLLVVIIGATYCGLGAWQIAMARASLAWPSVKGFVARAAVMHKPLSGSGGYYLDLEYRYEVGTEACIGSRWIFGQGMYRPEAELTEIVAPLHETAPIVVYYDPRKPSRSVIVPGVSGTAYVRVLGGLAGIAAGIYFLTVR